MKRFLVGCLLLVGAATPAISAPPEDEPRLVIRVPKGPAHVRVSREAIRRFWPTWKGESVAGEFAAPDAAKAEIGVRTDDAGLSLFHVLLIPATVVLSRSATTMAPSPDPFEPASSPAKERFVIDGEVFGSIASADPDIYDAGWGSFHFLAGLAPGGSFSTPLKLLNRAEGALDLTVYGVATHSGRDRLAATLSGVRLGGVDAVHMPASGTAFPFSGAVVPSDDAVLSLKNETASVQASGDPNDVSDEIGTIWIHRIEVDVPTKAHAGRRWRPWKERDEVFRVAEIDGGPLVRAWSKPNSPIPSIETTDWLAIATPALVGPAQRLADHRTKRGLRARVVSTTDLAPEGDGEALAGAMHKLVTDATGKTDGPRFLLLVGDADRDRGTTNTIPTSYARTLYNGATASDRPYGLDRDGKPLAIVGRLPFSDPKALDAYVDRVIRAETKPPVDETRRTVRFVTSEGRFGAAIDGLIENLFSQIVATQIPHSYDASVTFARAGSAYGWPAAEFNDKVIGDLNAGSLFFTYVGHGWWNGFDDLRVEGKRFPILKNEHASRVDVKSTSPAMFVIACTTALFDDPAVRSIGERLLDQPNGPIAYWGATRVCHPAWNSLVGRQIAVEMFPRVGPPKEAVFGDPSARRLGEVIESATRVAGGPPIDLIARLIESGSARMIQNPKVDLERLKREGAAMYVLLGDPAIRLPFPKHDLAVTSERTATGVRVTASGPFPDGTDVVLEVDVPRSTPLPFERDPSWSPEEAMRRRHARSNEKTLAGATVKAKGGKATADLPVAETRRNDSLFAIARSTYGDDVHVGSAPVPDPK